MDAELLERFIQDIIVNWKLRSPTIIFGEELTDLCSSKDMILCVTNDVKTMELAEHLAIVHKNYKQDGLIFVGSPDHEQLLIDISKLVPSMFTSNYPVFMPKEYSSMVELRLDSNFIFFENTRLFGTKLLDIFAVKGGPPIALEIGRWDIGNRMILHKGLNRWERRTDLNGAKFVNGVCAKGNWADLVKDDEGNIVQTTGYFQEKLFYIIGGLNLTIENFEYNCKSGLKLLKNGTWQGAFGMLQRKEIDVNSVGVGINIMRTSIIDFPVPTHCLQNTLATESPKGKAPNTWVYVRVFGVAQWSCYVTLLIILIIGLFLTNTLSKNHSKSSDTSEINQQQPILHLAASVIGMAYLYVIQMGSHARAGRLSTQILTLTTSLLTFVLFVYFTSDIISEMTSGPREIPVRNFDDVLEQGYKVVVGSEYYANLFAQGRLGSSVRKIYDTHVLSQEEFSDAYAFKKITKEPKTFAFMGLENTYSSPEAKKTLLTHDFLRLKLDVKLSANCGGQALHKDSEFLSLFNHFTLKEHEHGIIKVLFRRHHIEMFTSHHFGMSEPQPLGFHNVLFPFIFLGLAAFIAWATALAEFVHRKLSAANSALSA